MKTQSVFYHQQVRKTVEQTVQQYAWAKQAKEKMIADAAPWMDQTDDALWSMMFTASLPRAWMVWSNGFCPSCEKDVRMYAWKIDPWKHPWKVACPHCDTLFPKNDFHEFYRTGLNRAGVFDAKKADCILLYNEEHPDPEDPLHTFGVDDGNGFEADEHRWRFIGAYLIYGQWKQLVLAGIKHLAAAYVVTSNRAYAHKAAVLLDRVADCYPAFDFFTQGSAYETKHGSGYVSTWHDACEETREMAMAYDAIFDGMEEDDGMVAFLRKKARQTGAENKKESIADIRANIEAGLLLHPVEHPERIHNNYPRTEVALILLRTIADRDANRELNEELIDEIVEKATAVDGLTGEKGMAGYTSYVIHGLGVLLAMFDRIDPGFLPDLLEKHPNLRKTYRFHIDTLCMDRYYPRIGDTGSFGLPDDRYAGLQLVSDASLAPSMFTLLYRYYECLDDVAYLQTMFLENGKSVEGLPYDLFRSDTKKIQQTVQQAIDRHGPVIDKKSQNYQKWHLALLRSGQGASERVFWIDYDSGGKHAHSDGLNIGLFAKGADLVPDFGYPPVQYGGWNSKQAKWYRSNQAHNTVVIDDQDQKGGSEPTGGSTRFFMETDLVRAIAVHGNQIVDAKRFERINLMIDTGSDDSYIIDRFLVQGGKRHARYFSPTFGTATTKGINGTPIQKDGELTRGHSVDQPLPGWSIDWKLEDRLGVWKDAKRNIGICLTDYTEQAQLDRFSAWVVANNRNAYSNEACWLDRCAVIRQNDEGELSSDFFCVIEPYEEARFIERMETTAAQVGTGKPARALQVRHKNGRIDRIVMPDPSNPEAVRVDAWDLSFAGAWAVWIEQPGQPQRLIAAHVTRFSVANEHVDADPEAVIVAYRTDQGWNVELSE